MQNYSSNTSSNQSSNKIRGKTVAVTGAASGIGEALAKRFAVEGAGVVAVIDVNGDGAKRVANDISANTTNTNALAIQADVGDRAQITAAIEQIAQFGQVDIYCSNAGVATPGGLETTPADWDWNWRINTLAHIHAAEILMPQMAERKEGIFVITASAAGLLTEMSSISYSVVKHAAVAVAEWLSLEYADRGVQVSVLCPQGVRTGMFQLSQRADPVASVLAADTVAAPAAPTPADRVAAGIDGVLEPSDVADAVMEALANKRFLILPHPEVQTYTTYRAQDHDRWLKGMRRLRQKLG